MVSLHSHRPTIKQNNKAFKGGKSNKSKGRVQKATRINSAKQRTNQSLAKKPLRVVKSKTPKLVVFVPLCPDYSTTDLPSLENSYKCERNLRQIISLCKIADFIVFVISADEPVDEFGEFCMSTVKTIGIANTFSIVQHLEKHNEKQQLKIRASLCYYMSHHFPTFTQLFSPGSDTDMKKMGRHLNEAAIKGINWRDRHAYIVGNNVFVDSNGLLNVSGYVRGSNFSANQLLHIEGYGDFQMEGILDRKGEVIAAPDENQETLQAENMPDPMDAEQTWPTAEELADADERVRNMEHLEPETPFGGPPVQTKRVPKGTSSYQAAWIVEETPDDDAEDVDLDQPNQVPMENESDESEVEFEDVDIEDRSIHYNALDEEEEADQLQEYLNRQTEDKTHQDFPDEIDTPSNMPASLRFAKYRGLKSFKTSAWDPYESLPVDYGRVFQFQNFKRSKKRVMDTIKEYDISPGTFVTIVLRNGPTNILSNANFDLETPYDPNNPIALFALLPYEHKVSVVNFLVKKAASYDTPVKSKDSMLLICGFRTFIVHPIYSTYTRGGPNNVHKFERFLGDGQTVATIYAPIQFGPTPIMMFKYNESDNFSWGMGDIPSLVGTGSVLDADPLRITAKRVVLTGHPFKIHKRGAVIRYMFYSPADIEYFKPIQISTKYGRTGHIKESLGTHGYMKCVFDEGIKQNDTVVMMLYKRVFPKFNTREWKVCGAEHQDTVGDMQID